jgi:hypothetical protein
MSCGRGTVGRVRSVMAPGNPVPGDAYADSWQDTLGLEGRERVLALPREAAARQPEALTFRPGSAATRGGRWAVGGGSLVRGRAHRVLGPAAAMVATAAVIAGVTLAAQYLAGRYEPMPSAGHAPMPSAARRAALGPGPVAPPPPFFVGRVGGLNDTSLGVYRATTGRMVARLAPPAGLAFAATAATADSHVFVLAAVPRRSSGACATWLYRLGLSAAGQPSLTRLAVPKVAGRLRVPTALAASATGKVIGYSTFTCRTRGYDSGHVGVIDLATGRVRTWELHGTVLGMSASADGRALAFTFTGSNGRPTADMLRTDAAPGPMARRARVVVSTAAIGAGQVAVNRTGGVLLACAQNASGEPRQTARLAAYNAATGHLIGVLRSWQSWLGPCTISAVPAGGYLLVTGFQEHDIARIDLITGRVTELPFNNPQIGISW